MKHKLSIKCCLLLCTRHREGRNQSTGWLQSCSIGDCRPNTQRNQSQCRSDKLGRIEDKFLEWHPRSRHWDRKISKRSCLRLFSLLEWLLPPSHHLRLLIFLSQCLLRGCHSKNLSPMRPSLSDLHWLWFLCVFVLQSPILQFGIQSMFCLRPSL